MKNIRLLYIAAVFLLFITIACRAGDKEPAFIFPDRTPDEIIKNIKPFLNENNIQLDQYTLESISYDYMKSRWHVSYSGKSLAIGDHFSIVVGDNLKEIKLIPGL
jgi:hypothetical protein